MSDWDADSDEGSSSKPAVITAPVAPTPAATISYGRRKFEDEDLEDEIKDDWEEDEDEEDGKQKADVSSLQPIKKKSTVKQKIKEREEEEKRRAELGEESDDDILEDPLEKRRRERAAQIEADIANAANLLGTSKIQENGSDGLKLAKGESKEDWEKYATDVYISLLKLHSTKPGYGKYFIPAFTKLLADNLRDVDCRKQSTDWKKIGEDKLKAERDKKANPAGKKKPEKPKAVGTASAKNKIDTSAYGDEALGDDDLDFM